MIMRTIDDLGRIVIPKDIRKSLGISEGDVMDISVLDNSVSIRKHFDEHNNSYKAVNENG